MRALWSILREPISEEKRALLRARWDSLPENLRTDWQVVGKHHVHCGYTLGPSYCSFGCTHCYLPRNANQVPIPDLADMKAQIDANRRLIGPGGGLQITGGDVVDAYWRAGRQDELVEVVGYATEAGVVPMLMTHGQLLLENPDYLERLVREGGLRKLAVHIDITQAGRRGFPIRELESEADLHPLRASFVDLILDIQRRTRTNFFAAHTVTVTERNIGSLGEIFDWLRADPRHLQAFRMISLQPEADVGRTRFSSRPVTPEATWEAVASSLGVDMARDNLWFGHPDCSSMTSLAVRYPEGRVINLIGSDPKDRAFWVRILDVYGGIGGRGADRFAHLLRKLRLTAGSPSIVAAALRYGLYVARREGLGPGFFGALLRGRVQPLNIVMHNFMSAEEVAAPRSPVVEERLQACSFQGAMRRGDEWVAVPMCAMNGVEREDLYSEKIAATADREAAAELAAGG